MQFEDQENVAGEFNRIKKKFKTKNPSTAYKINGKKNKDFYNANSKKDTSQQFLIQNVDVKKGQNVEKVQNQLVAMSLIESQYHVKYCDVFFFKDTYFIVTEQIEKSIEDLISTAQRLSTSLSEAFCNYTLYCLCVAVSDMHKSRVIHRNISPSNIFVGQDRALLSNMKDSVFLVKTREYRNSEVGLQIYQSPEVFNQDVTYNQCCDIWSIGMVALVLMCGTEIAREQLCSMDQANIDARIDAAATTSHMSQDYSQFVKECLKFNANERADIDQLLRMPLLNDRDTMKEDWIHQRDSLRV